MAVARNCTCTTILLARQDTEDMQSATKITLPNLDQITPATPPIVILGMERGSRHRPTTMRSLHGDEFLFWMARGSGAQP